MSRTTVGFLVGGAAVVAVILVVVLITGEERIKSPCSSDQDPDSILEPEPDRAVTVVSGEDSLCVFCIVPCETGACNDTMNCSDTCGTYADYVIQAGEDGTQITLIPKATEDKIPGETIIEIQKLPESWSQYDKVYGQYHFMIYRIYCEEGIGCEGKEYTLEYEETPAGIGGFIMTLTESPPAISALKE